MDSHLSRLLSLRRPHHGRTAIRAYDERLRDDVLQEASYFPTGFRRPCRVGVFEHKKMPLRANFYFSLLDSITMGFQNLSLGNNSVSFYQMCKLLVAPCTVVIQRVFYGERLPSPAVSMALAILLVRLDARNACPPPHFFSLSFFLFQTCSCAAIAMRSCVRRAG